MFFLLKNYKTRLIYQLIAQLNRVSEHVDFHFAKYTNLPFRPLLFMYLRLTNRV